ncbi:MAG TPA: GAF domain-containing protein [Frankiaceae bacterium]|nr:GAF domain-containing protein [Frankiaceae bacterium]
MVNSDVLHLGNSPNAVPQARQFVVQRLMRGDLSRFVDDAELAVAELVTNALLHAAPPVSLRILCGGDLVRVEVADGSRSAPVRGRADVASMTGRGLALIEALSLRWGVEPAEDGKVVWAEIGPEAADGHASPTDLDGDVDALLAAWADDAPAEEHFAIRLGDVPTELLLNAKAHVDSLVREFALAASGARTGSSSAVPWQLAELIETVVHRFAGARLSIKRQALAAAVRGYERTNLTLTLPASAAEDADAYLAGLDEADSYARAARLLTLETPPQHRTFRRWYISSLVAQLHAAAARQQPPALESFEHRLLDELGEEATARANLERIAGLQSVTAALAGATTTGQVAEVVVNEGVRTLGALGGGLILPDKDGKLQVPSSVGYGDRLLHRLRTEPQDAELPAAEALRTGRPVWLESPQERDDRFPGLIGMEPGTSALCAVPLVVGERRLGALRFSFSDPRLFDGYERRFVLGLAAQTAQAIDRAQLYDAERRAREQAESLAARLVRLQQVAAELGRAMSVEDVAEVVVTHAAEAVGSGLATVSLLSDDETLEVIKARGISADARQRWHRYPVSAELPGSIAVRTGEAVIVASVAEMEQRFPLLAGQAEDESSMICVPMRVGSRTIGVISLNFPPGRDVGSRTELAFFASLANTCAQAVERSRAVASLETAVAKLSFLADATSELSSSLDYRTTLAKIASLVVPRLADWCAVDLVGESGLERVAVAHIDPAKVAYAQQLERTYPTDPNSETGVPKVLRTGVSELYPSITDAMLVAGARDDEHLRVSRELGLRSALVVPLRGAKSTLGALTLVAAESGRRYDEEDLAFAEDIARRAAVAVENARAFEHRAGS